MEYHLPSSSCKSHVRFENILLNDGVLHRKELNAVLVGIQKSPTQPGHLLSDFVSPTQNAPQRPGPSVKSARVYASLS